MQAIEENYLDYATVMKEFLRLKALRSPRTAEFYERCINLVTGGETATFLKLASSDKRRAKMQILAWIEKEASRGISGRTIKAELSGIVTLCEHCEISLPWKQISDYIPKAPPADRKAAPHEAIVKLWNSVDLHGRFIISMEFTGCRVGAFNYWSYGDLEEILVDGVIIGKVTVYRNEPEEYTSFLDPEKLAVVRTYFERRKNAGEVLTPTSPLLRQNFGFPEASLFEYRIAKADSACVQDFFRRAWAAAGYPSKFQVEKRGMKGIPRTWPYTHGFRKYTETRLETVGHMKHEDAEMILGHKLPYRKPDVDYLAGEFVKAMPSLYISEEYNLTKRVEEKENELHHAKIDLKAELIVEQDARKKLELQMQYLFLDKQLQKETDTLKQKELMRKMDELETQMR